MEEIWPQVLAAAPPVIYVLAYLIYVIGNIGDGASKRLSVMQRENELIQSLPAQSQHRELLLGTLDHRIEAHRWKTVRRVDGASAAALVFLLGVLGAATYGLTIWGMTIQNSFFSLMLYGLALLAVLTALGFLGVGLKQMHVDPTGKRRDGKQTGKKDRINSTKTRNR